MLKEPFQLLARGVRAVETITAEVMEFSESGTLIVRIEMA
jgi:hypothetical protein